MEFALKRPVEAAGFLMRASFRMDKNVWEHVLKCARGMGGDGAIASVQGMHEQLFPPPLRTRTRNTSPTINQCEHAV